MKTLAALLVVANLVAFAWWQGRLDRWLPGSREPHRLEGQVAPEKLKLVPLARLEQRPAARVVANADRCMEVGPLDVAAYARVAAWVSTLGEGARGEAAPPRYRVHFAATLEPADLLARRAELAAAAGLEPGGCAGTGEERKP